MLLYLYRAQRLHVATKRNAQTAHIDNIVAHFVGWMHCIMFPEASLLIKPWWNILGSVCVEWERERTEGESKTIKKIKSELYVDVLIMIFVFVDLLSAVLFCEHPLCFYTAIPKKCCKRTPTCKNAFILHASVRNLHQTNCCCCFFTLRSHLNIYFCLREM